ncbi:hypothetical protein FA95DRAFT_1578719 [Auriscalpium vulgare]|uniref:Uncharacterized protein n=1 Tax=Auriscalpium vulgare TaxID=40419 RepID=A0ACB8R1L4_9AGAM|nr:hypothetical protein FA95DRAFT_1578719 [Auriscalpium vulgare]
MLASGEVVSLGPDSLEERVRQVRAYYEARDRRRREAAERKQREEDAKRAAAHREEADRRDRDLAARRAREEAERLQAQEDALKYIDPGAAVPSTACHHGCRSHRKHWYVVFAGVKTGVFANWGAMADYVLQVPLNVHCKFATKAAADRAYAQALEEGHVHVWRRR